MSRGVPTCWDDAVLHNGDTVADGHCLFLIVGDVHGGDANALLGVADDAAHLDTELCVQIGKRLVHQQHIRRDDQCASQCDTLLLTAGKLVGQVFELIAQTHPLKGSFCRRVALCGGDARIHKGNFHVLQKCQLRKQVVLLEDEAQLLVPDVCQLTAAHLADIPAVQQISAFGRHVQTADDVHTSGFTRTGLADDGHELAFFRFSW